MATSQTINAAIGRFALNEELVDRVVNGDDATDVQTAGGIVPTLAKTMRLLGEKSVGASDEFLAGLETAVNARANTMLAALETRVNVDADGITEQAQAAAGSAITSATSASNNASSAGTAAGVAYDSATSATSSATSATAAKNLAYAWAVQLDTPVAEGLFSARHYAAAAKASADSIAAGPVYSVNDMTGVVTINKGTVGLSKVENLAPSEMPVSLQAQQALDAKADLTGGKVPTSQLPTTDGINEGTSKLFLTAARVRDAVLTGIVFTANAAVVAADSVVVGLGKMQAQFTALAAAAIIRTGANGAARIPVGTNAQRPPNEKGLLRYSDSSGRFEGNNGAAWGSLGGATGGGNDALFYLADKTMTADYTIPAGQAAMRPGGLVIADGIKLKIDDGGSLTLI